MSYASDALIDALKRENNKLKADNERLRQDIEDQESYDQMLRDRLRQLTELHVESNAENAKLRKLCADLFKLADEAYVPFKNTNKWMNELVDIESRMRELRIEVPE